MFAAAVLAVLLVAVAVGGYSWIVRRPYDPYDPDSRRYRGDWVLWRMQLNRKDEMQ